jgi:2-keto-4-pentenoate hydratase/2-oxohepta-3-ene-1,7-dioic acid hydratase in catechol pathway
MKIIRFVHKNRNLWGVLNGRTVRVLTRPPFSGISYSKEDIAFSKVRLLPPADPQKIILVGLNYKDHAKELGMNIPKQPVIFLKPPTALLAPAGNIVHPKQVKRLDFEAELAIVIKKKAKDIPQPKVNDYILGYTCLNDVTARDLQNTDGQWTRAKSFDSFCPVGPYIQTGIDPNKLAVSSYLNGKLKQSSSTENLIFPIPKLVSFISKIMTLMPGDIVSTGTPPGVGRMKPGDKIEVVIEGIGSLKNNVVKPY